MKLREIAKGYAVSPQLSPADMAALAELGVTTVICNRPDSEVSVDLQAAALQEAAAAAGLHFVYNPVVGFGMPHEAIDEQSDAIDGADGKVVAYCASGMRSALMWALAMAGREPAEDLLRIVADAGYRMDHLVGQVDGIGQARRGR